MRHPTGLITAAALALTLLTTVPSDAAPRGRHPDLIVPTASLATRDAVPGGSLRLAYAVRNTGTATARPSTLRVELGSGDRPVVLASVRTPRLLPRRAERRAALTVTVPLSVADGSYAVRVCTDARDRVAERDERNNCRVAGTLRIQRPVVPPTTTPPTTTPPTTPTPPTPSTPIPAMDVTDLDLDSFATAYGWPEDESDTVAGMQASCGATYPVTSYSPTAAVASLRARLTREAGSGMSALAQSPAYGDPLALQELAAAGIAQGSPGLALAALLRAADLEPTIGTHLVNAAAVAVSIGAPNEALALLDAANGRVFRAPAAGVPQQAVAATVRGQALVMTGRPEEARAWFLTARAAAPVLSEAEAGLAQVAACADDEVRAARLVRKSRQRTLDRSAPEEETPRPDPLDHIDLAAGRTTALRHVSLAATPAQAVARIEGYDATLDEYTAEIDDHHAHERTLEAQLDDADEVASDAERDRRHGLMNVAFTSTLPAVEAAEDEIDRVLDDLTEQREAFWGGGTGEAPYTYGEILDDSFEACDDMRCQQQYMNDHCRPALRAEHQEWLALMARLQAAEDLRIALLSQLMSSVAAHLAEPSAHDLVTLQIESLESAAHGGIVTRAWIWARDAQIRAEDCVEPLPDEFYEGEDEPDAESDGPCTDDAAKVSLKLALGPSEVKVNCEKIQQEFSLDVLPLLKAFVEVSYDARSGTMTIVGGAKAKGSAGGVEGSFKSGLYLTVDARDGGSIRDVGWQVGPELTAGAAGVEVEFYKDEMDLSFVSGLRGD